MKIKFTTLIQKVPLIIITCPHLQYEWASLKGVNYLLPNLVIYILITCWNVNKGKIYLEKTYIKVNNVKKEKDN